MSEIINLHDGVRPVCAATNSPREQHVRNSRKHAGTVCVVKRALPAQADRSRALRDREIDPARRKPKRVQTPRSRTVLTGSRSIGALRGRASLTSNEFSPVSLCAWPMLKAGTRGVCAR